MLYLLFYEKGSDYAERQRGLEQAHRAHLEEAVRRGELILGGNLHDPADGSALLLFDARSPAAAEAVAAADPYVTRGVVVRWHVRAWDTVIGTRRLP